MYKRGFVLIVTCLAASLFAVSCSTTPERNRGSLEDAMEKARDDHEGSRRVPDRARPPDYESPPYRDTDDGEDPVSTAPSDGGSDATAVHFGLRGSSSVVRYGDLGSDWAADLVVSADVSHSLGAGAFVGIRSVEPVRGSSLDLSVDGNLYFLRAGIEATYLPVPELRVLCPYLTAGLGGFVMLWSFENAVIAGSERIDSDTLGGVLLFCGVGVYPYRGDRLRLSVGLIPELYLFGSVTNEGFDNDFFSPMTSVSVRAELSL